MSIIRPTISIVILAYNSAQFIGETMDSVLAEAQSVPSEVIVVDNGSQDDTFEQLQKSYGRTAGVTIFRNIVGLGYSAGNNAAARLASGEILLLLNDDCVLEEGALQGIRDDFAEDSDLGIVQCALATADGRRWESLGHFLDSWGLLHVVGQGSDRVSRYPATRQVFGAKGAAFAVRRRVFEGLGGFDSSYGFLFEETDFCWRALLQGFKVAVSGRAVVRHKDMARYKGEYGGREGSAFYMLTRNRMRSMVKNFSGRYLLAAAPVHLFLMLAYSLRESWPNRPEVVCDLFRAIWWNALRFRSTLELRRQIQGTRVVSDSSLVRAGRLFRPSIARLMHHPTTQKGHHHA